MCGIVGIAALRGAGRIDPGLVAGMAETLAHRGPDGSCVEEVGFPGRSGPTFGLRRLGIVDLGAGARLFADESGRIRSVCNGEIYNAPELRRDLLARGHRLGTRCDTEVIPHLYEESGLDCARRMNGMFAFAIFDAHLDRLVLGRDRAGEKPLYYLQQDGELMFASEIKALLAHPRVAREIDPQSIGRYLLFGYVPAPRTAFRSIRKLPAGCLLIAEKGETRLQRYWDLRVFAGSTTPADEVAAPGVADATPGDSATTPGDRAAARRVRGLLEESVRLRLRADVPVGVLFSGGVDSSILAALAVDIAGRPVPTFTIGFEDRDFDESAFARRAAAHLGTEHHEMRAGEADLIEGLVAAGRLMDEPLADPSLIPTFLLARFARDRVKVALCGEGGDELFAGYPTYIGDRLAGLYRRIPRALRAAIARAVDRIPPAFDNAGIGSLLKKFVSAAGRPRLDRHQAWFGIATPGLRRSLLSKDALDALEPPADARGAGEDDPLAELRALFVSAGDGDPLNALLLLDFLTYLQDDLLTKMDRASMAVSLEVRAPFLHHPLVELAAALPGRMKIRGLTSKFILKRAMVDRLTPEILRRRKRGFAMPIARLMHGPLRPLLARALEPERVARGGLLRPDTVQTILREHLERRRDHARVLHALLMLQIWQARHVHGEDLLEAAPRAVSLS